jgi:antitoxin (DNA-binding transcriptional repressor) of toxin-antitoxin stability system
MKQKVTAREFLHRFAKVHQKLAPGQSVTITKHGKPLGRFVKEPAAGTRLPDFRKDASADGYAPEVGDELLSRILADETIS